jgi:HSP20 family protein
MITRFVTPGSSLLDELLSQSLSGHKANVNHSPKFNIQETNDEFFVELAVPGYSKNDFQINVEDKQLIIKVEQELTDESNYLKKEFSKYNFEKKFTLSEKIDAENIKASYEFGILSLSLPKKEEARVKPPKLIEIK